MKRILTFTFFYGFLSTAFGQSEFSINDLSDKLYAKVTVGKDGYGKATIMRKADNVSVLTAEGSQFDYGLEAGQKTVLYKDQSLVVYEDFNFDGVKDLAIQEGFSSKGPVYDVYLSSQNTFKKDDEFTGIIQESQGNYTLDPANKTISIMSSGGCCYHTSATYGVKAGRTFPIRERSEEISPPFTIIITREWKDGKKTETTDKTLELSEDPMFSFVLASNKKKVLLFSTDDKTLNYALVKGNDKVEFNFPVTVVYKNPDFKLSPSRNELTFKNASAEYKIYQNVTNGKIDAIGILVKTGGKEYDLKGDVQTLRGKLSDVVGMNNVVK